MPSISSKRSKKTEKVSNTNIVAESSSPVLVTFSEISGCEDPIQEENSTTPSAPFEKISGCEAVGNPINSYELRSPELHHSTTPSAPLNFSNMGERSSNTFLRETEDDSILSENGTFPETFDIKENASLSKKRGRKPRGGKLVIKPSEQNTTVNAVSNVILHLKCSLNDLNEYNNRLSKIVTNPLEYNPDVPPDIVTYNESKPSFSIFDKNYSLSELGSNHFGNENEIGRSIHERNSNWKPTNHNNEITYKTDNKAYDSSMIKSNTDLKSVCSICLANKNETDVNNTFDSTEDENDVNIKDINYKLKMLKVQLYKNSLQNDKKSACFWCTYDFDNTACYIPKYEMDDMIYGYGSFCRPECAAAYLMKENIDDSTKFERYHLLNQIYSKVYNCKKNIKPAPNPYYLLDKFYGNLSIQEYRKLLKTEHLLLVIDKPLTRILPELHEDNEDMIMNIYGINKSTNAVSGVYKVKRQSEKQSGPSKASIIRNKFGLA